MFWSAAAYSCLFCNATLTFDWIIFFLPFVLLLLGLTAPVLPPMTRVCLRSRPRPPRSIQAERDELLSAAHHPVFFMFAFFLDKKKESAHTPKSFTRLKAPLHVFFFSSLCARVHKCLTSTHAHQTLHQPCVVSQEGNIKGPVAVGMRSLETSVVQQRQLESPVATGSLEKEVGLQNKEGLENKVSLGSAARFALERGAGP